MTVDKGTSCGLFSYRPQWAQRFATQKVYLFVYTLVGIAQSMTFSYLTVVLSTIEKRFGLKSKEATWIYSGNEISQIFFILFLPFVGRVRKRPLFMGLSILLSAFGLLIVAIPHFTGEQKYLSVNQQTNYVKSNGTENLCNGGRVEAIKDICDGTSHKDWASLGVVFLGIFLLGFGVSFYFSFGLPYVDDNTAKANSPLSLSIVMAARIIGPTLGYMLGSACLAVYVDPGKAPEGLNEDSPRWVGAWWIGFVVLGISLMIFSPWLTLFPSRLASDKRTDGDKLERDRINNDDEPETVAEWIAELKAVCKRLFTSKVFMFNLFSGVFLLFGIVGFATFIPKYIEAHFRQRASTSGAAGGIAKSVSSVIGLIVSGYVIGRWKFRARALASWCVFADLLAILGCASIALFACPKPIFSDIDVNRSSILSLSCNNNCKCDGISYSPVCSTIDNATNYFSACHAGCSSVQDDNGTLMFDNCACLSNTELSSPLLSGTSAPIDGMVKDGICTVDCQSTFFMLLGVLFIFSLVGSTTRIPNFLLSLRSIEVRDKAASITLTVSILSLLAFLPSPIIYGAIMDETCILWDTTSCGETTHCLVYDTDRMRNYMALMPSVCLILTLLCDIGVWYYAKGMNIYDSEDETPEKAADHDDHPTEHNGHHHMHEIKLDTMDAETDYAGSGHIGSPYD